MQLKFVDCPSNTVEVPLIWGVTTYDDVMVCHHGKGSVTTWDIGDPLNIRQLGAADVENASNSVIHDKNLYLYRTDKIHIYSVSDPVTIKKLNTITFEVPCGLPSRAYSRPLDIAVDGTLWAVNGNGAIGVYDMSGAFTEHISPIAELVEAHTDLAIKAVNDLVAVSHTEYGVLVYGKNANGKLHLLKHIPKGMEYSMGIPITGVCDNQMLLLASHMGVVPIDLHDTNKIKKLKKFIPLYEIDNRYGLCFIDLGPSMKESLSHNAHEVLAFGSLNDSFELALLDVSPAGVTRKDKVRQKHPNRKFTCAISGMFLKGNHLILLGNLPKTPGNFEVFEFSK